MPAILLFPNFAKFIERLICKRTSYMEEFHEVKLASIVHAELEEQKIN